MAGSIATESKKFPWARILVLIVVIVAIVLAAPRLGAAIPAFQAKVQSLGVWGPVAFIVGYALAVVAFVPGSALTLAAGAIFGLTHGVLYVFIAAVLGSSLAFLVARYGARRAIEKKLEGNQRFAAIDKAIGSDGRKIVFLLRLSPVFPFSLLNYALGLTKVRFLDYLIASVGMLPGTILYVYSGSIGGNAAQLAGGSVQKGAGYYAVLVLGLLATVAVTLYVTKKARAALAAATAERAS